MACGGTTDTKNGSSKGKLAHRSSVHLSESSKQEEGYRATAAGNFVLTTEGTLGDGDGEALQRF